MRARPRAEKSNKRQYHEYYAATHPSPGTHSHSWTSRWTRRLWEETQNNVYATLLIFIIKYFILNALIVCFGLLIFSHIMEMLEI